MEKMLADENLDLGTDRSGDQQYAEPEHGRYHQGELQGAPPFATEIANVITDAGHEKQVNAGGEQGYRMEGRLL